MNIALWTAQGLLGFVYLVAGGLVIVQIGAMRVHLTRNERQPLPVNVILLLLAAFVAIVRFTN
jgi:hypothetical protein